MTSLPTRTNAIVLHAYNLDGWRVEEYDLPPLKPEDVLLRVTAAPLNPSDVAFLQGMYGIRKPLPTIPGFEGGGQVIAVGEKLNAADWIGRRAACLATGTIGTYTEYLVTHSSVVLPVTDDISDDAASMMLVNPLTAWALIDMAAAAGVKAVIQTAAASALGKMLRRFGESRGIAVINIVRRAAQVESLTAEGAAHVLDSSSETFDGDLRGMASGLGARMAFDAVGGSLTDRILRAMPNGSRIVVYGGLEGSPVSVGVDQFIFRDKQVQGFWLSSWMPQNPVKVAAAWAAIQAQSDAFRSEVRARFSLDRFDDALRLYTAQMSGGKVLIAP